MSRRLRALRHLLDALVRLLREKTARVVAGDLTTKAAAFDGAAFWREMSAHYWRMVRTPSAPPGPPNYAI